MKVCVRNPIYILYNIFIYKLFIYVRILCLYTARRIILKNKINLTRDFTTMCSPGSLMLNQCLIYAIHDSSLVLVSQFSSCKNDICYCIVLLYVT